MRMLLIALGALAWAVPVSGQALTAWTDAEAAQLVRAAVLAGRLAPDVWPLPFDEDGTGPTGNASVGLTPTWTGRWGTLDPVPHRQNPAAGVDLGAQDRGRWALGLSASFWDEVLADRADNLVRPEAGNPLPFDNHFLTRGWLWASAGAFSVEVGRDQVHQGPLDHSLLLSADVPWLDQVHSSLRSGPFALDWIVATPETRTASGTVVTRTELLNLHRLAWRADTWTLAVAELTLVTRGTTGGPFVLADLFPVFVTHQGEENPNNNLAVAEASWVPVPGLRLMAQGGLDDVNAGSVGVTDTAVPTIPAWQAGAEVFGRARGGDWTLHAEGGATHYLWGNYTDETGSRAARAVVPFLEDRQTLWIPLTSPYGPGAVWVEGRGAWAWKAVTLGLKTRALWTHPGVDLDVPYEAHPAWEGVGSHWVVRTSVQAAWRPWPWGEVTLEPGVEAAPGTWGWDLALGFRGLWSTR